ncbi:MAG: hypothetical protein ACOCTL_02065 [Candidatus Hadarchaeota archaeon]
MKDRVIATIGILLALLNVVIPYLFFKNTSDFWINYLFWSLLTLSVVIAGTWKIRKWGEK